MDSAGGVPEGLKAGAGAIESLEAACAREAAQDEHYHLQGRRPGIGYIAKDPAIEQLGSDLTDDEISSGSLPRSDEEGRKADRLRHVHVLQLRRWRIGQI